MRILITVTTPGGQSKRHLAEIEDETRELPDAIAAAVDAFRSEFRNERLAEYSTVKIERI